MFDKNYGKCEILGGDKNFNLLIEYRYALRKDKDYYGSCECSACGFDPNEYSTVIIGRDIVTRTPVISIFPSKLGKVVTINDAAKLKMIKRGKLIAMKYERLSIDDMSNCLNKMTNEEANEYIKKVNELKAMYSEAIIREKINSNNHKVDERIKRENLEAERERVKKLVKKASK